MVVTQAMVPLLFPQALDIPDGLITDILVLESVCLLLAAIALT